MKISELIVELQKVKRKMGNIEVTCTASCTPDSTNGIDGLPFESTVENLIVGEHTTIGKRVRLYL